MKNFITIILILMLLALGGAIAYLYLQSSQPTSQTNPGESSANLTATTTPLFPSGHSRPLSPEPTNGTLSASTSAPAAATTKEPNQTLSRFRLAAAGPIADLLLTVAASGTQVWYWEKNTGHLFRLAAGEIKQETNTTLPGLTSATGANNRFILRYYQNNQLQNQLAILQPAIATTTELIDFNPEIQLGQLTSRSLPATAKHFVISPDQKSFAYLNRANNQTELVVSDWDLKRPTNIWQTPLQELDLAWLGIDTFLLTTAPSGRVAGFSYLFNRQSGRLTRLIHQVPGLQVTPSPNGEWLLYSGTSNNQPFVALYDLKKQQVHNLQLATWVNKCTWAKDSRSVYCAVPVDPPAGLYPDAWLSGELATSDRLWEINPETQKSQLIFNPLLQQQKKAVDAAKLIYDPNENRLYVLDKSDLSLWSLDLNLGF